MTKLKSNEYIIAQENSVLNGIQILRFLAALLVVFAHYNFMDIRFGAFGVDIFFVISGFIISTVVSYNTKDFLKKRIARVVPLYSIATLLTFTLAVIFPSWFNNIVLNKCALIKSLLFIPYRIENSGPILSLGWTLNNEMFFYGIMAICIFLFNRKGNLPIVSGVFLSLIFLVLNILHINVYIFWFFENGLIPEFIFGILLYYLWRFYKSNQSIIVDSFVFALAALAIAYMIYCDMQNYSLFGSRNLDRGIPSFIVVFSFLIIDKYFIYNHFLVKLSIKLGEASYFMYLFHPFILFGLTRLIYPIIFNYKDSLVIEFLKLLISIFAVLVISLIGYRYLDKPIGRFTSKLLKI